MKSKICSILLITFICFSFIGCGGNKSKSDAITIWAYLNDSAFSDFKELCDEYSKQNNVKINAVQSELSPIEYLGAKDSANSKPDIIWGMSSEETEYLKESNGIEKLPDNMDNEEDYITKDLIENTSIDGTRYGVPISQETLGLFYNKDLVSEVPDDMDKLIDVAKDKGLSFSINDGYFSYGFISTCGGYIFKNNNGTFDGDDIGLNNDGAIKGYEYLKKLSVDNKIISADITEENAEMNFASGNVAFYIGEEKQIPSFKKLKMNYGVAVIPKIDGNDFKPFKEIKMAFVNPSSDKKDKSFELIKYLAQNDSKLLMEKQYKIPVLKKDIESDEFKNNEDLKGFYDQLQTAEVTPNIQKLKAYWDVTGNDLQVLTLGKKSPEQFGKKLEKDVKEFIKQMK